MRLFLTAAALSLAFSSSVFAAPRVDPAVYEKLDVFAHVLEKIRTSYVETVTETEVIENAINGMLTSLDPHSSYMKTEEFKGLQEQTQGEFGGLGIEVTMDGGLVKVVSPIEDTPAALAGLQSGDLITRIDAKDVQGITLKDAVDMMRGKPDTQVKLLVFRESEKRTFPVTLTRAVIKVKPVKAKLLESGIGYLRITAFNEYTDSALQDHFATLVKDNKAPLNGLILDLRNNPGGLLNQAIAVADDFLVGGEVVSTRGRIEGQNARYSAQGGDIMNGKPILVLINGGSASAAEIVAGALQDNKRAITVGTKSFGKGSVQTVFNLPGGTGMRLTTALYYTPAGRSIQAKGIEPDIEIKAPAIKTKNGDEFDESMLPTEAGLQGHITTDTTAEDKAAAAERVKNLPAALQTLPPAKDTTPTTLGTDGKPDFQLSRALEMMKVLLVSKGPMAGK
ncbi:MAG: S41 family peptidase [Alphaproteobacteria bacterium]